MKKSQIPILAAVALLAAGAAALIYMARPARKNSPAANNTPSQASTPQPGAEADPASPGPTPYSATTSANEQRKIDLDLPPDSTLGDFVALLEKNYPEYAINFSKDEFNDVKIGEIKLRNASLSDLSMTLLRAGRGRFATLSTNNNTLFIRRMQSESTPPQINDPDRPKMDFDLPADAKLSDIIALLKTKYPQYGFYLPNARLGDSKMGALKLLGATMYQLVDALNAAGREGKFGVRTYDNRNIYFSYSGPLINKINAFNIGPWIGDARDDAAAKKVQQLDGMIAEAILAGNPSGKVYEMLVPKSAYFPAGKVYVLVGTGPGVGLASKVMNALVPKVIPAATPFPGSGVMP